MSYQTDPLFKALSDETRRAILEALAAGPKPVHVIAGGFPVSRPAISKHLRILAGSGLISGVKSGKETFYALEPEALAAVRDWIDGFWRTRLNTLKRLVETDA
jgi:DNA-binding transcriptional ArsR family regulator